MTLSENNKETETEKKAGNPSKNKVEEKLEETREILKSFSDLDPKEIEKILELINKILDIVRGVKDVKGRLAPLMEPEGISLETSARLSQSQIQACSYLHILPELYGFFQPLESVAKHRELISISEDGKGRVEAINLMGAYGGSELLKNLGLGFNVQPGETDLARKKAEKKGIFR